MNILPISLADLESPGFIAQIGFVGENECTQVAINCSDVFVEYPTALPSLTVKAPNHCEPYPSMVERNDFSVVWTVTNANLAEEGVGEFQLTFTVSNVVKKSYTAKYRVKKSLMPTGPIPDPLDDFITRAGALISEINQIITDTIVATVPEWARQTSKPDYTAEEVGALPEDTFIPERVSDLIDDSGHYIKPTNGIPYSDLEYSIYQDIDGKANKPQNPVNGHLVTMDVMGNLTDSGKYPFDYILAAQKGAVNGVAELDPNGKVPSSQLPSFVDDVVEYASASVLPIPGETGKIYVTKDTNYTYRWSGSTYVEIGSSLALGETSSTAYRGDRGATAYAHATDASRVQTARLNGFFKIGATEEGHVSSLIAVTKQDIENLGIPGDVSDKADKADTILDTTLSRGRKANTTVGIGSFAFGDGVEASGVLSHAEGGGTVASGVNSHAEGVYTIAEGVNSHVGGMYNVADSYKNWPEWAANTEYAVGDKVKITSGNNVSGYVCATANTDSEFTYSKWINQNGRMNYAEIVGNGTAVNARSNAYALDWDGTGHFAGDVYVNCNSDSTGGTKLATVDDIANNKDVFLVTITSEEVSGETVYYADKTFAQIKEAVLAGMEVIAVQHLPGGSSLLDEYTYFRLDYAAVSDEYPNAEGFMFMAMGGGVTTYGFKFTRNGGIEPFNYTAIDDGAGIDDTDRVWSADKLAHKFSVLEPAATSSDVGKFLKAKTVSNGKVTEYEFSNPSNPPLDRSLTSALSAAPADLVGDLKNALSGKQDNIIDDVSNDMEGTTQDVVFVKKDDSGYGNNDPMMFSTQEGKTWNGIIRTDESVVYPVAGLGSLPTANAPRRRLMGIIRTWIGRENFVHTADEPGVPDTTTLFGDDCEADENEKFHLDCSGFVSAVLMGITYENSRYILGKSKNNIVPTNGEFFAFPESEAASRTQGGLFTFELAKFFAERKLLFNIPENKDIARKVLKFGDILFASDTNNKTYYGIGHCAFVLGVVEDYIIVAHCSSDTVYRKEPSIIHMRYYDMTNRLQNGFNLFARPDYTADKFKGLNPITSHGAMVIRDGLTPGMEIILDASQSNPDILPGMIKCNTHFSAFEDYIPVTPGSVVAYTGALSNTRGNLSCRIHQYDAQFKQVSRGNTLVYLGTSYSPITLESTTKYIRPSFGWLGNSPNQFYFSDMDDFEITIKTDSGVEVVSL